MIEHLLALTNVLKRATEANENKDHKLALELFSQALEMDPENNYAAYEMAQIYENGLDTPKDIEKALYYYKWAANNVTEAQLRLSEIYEYGIGVSVDKEAAREWRAMALAEQRKQEQDANKPPLTLAESIRRAVEKAQQDTNF